MMINHKSWALSSHLSHFSKLSCWPSSGAASAAGFPRTSDVLSSIPLHCSFLHFTYSSMEIPCKVEELARKRLGSRPNSWLAWLAKPRLANTRSGSILCWLRSCSKLSYKNTKSFIRKSKLTQTVETLYGIAQNQGLSQNTTPGFRIKFTAAVMNYYQLNYRCSYGS